MRTPDRDRTIARLRDVLSELTYHWEPNPQGSDYRCVFCGEEGRPPNQNIDHEPDCLGMDLMQVL